MKSIKLLFLLQFVVLCAFAQDKNLTSLIQSRTADDNGVTKNLVFKENARPNFENAANTLKQFLGASAEVTFKKINSETDRLGMTHARFQQYYKNMPVEFATYNVHVKSGKIISINGEFYPLEKMNTTTSLTKASAITTAKKLINAEKYLDHHGHHEDHDAHDIGYDGPNPTLVIFPAIKGISTAPTLAYKLDIYAEEPLYRADVYIDAQSGKLIYENNQIHHANVAASGTSLYNGTVNFTADQTGSNSYRLRQTASGGGIQTYDMNNGTSYNNASDVTSTSTSFTGSGTAVQAHWGAENTYDYFFQKHGRNSYNGNGAVIRSYVSYGNNYVNAFWNGSVMTYGDGNGTTYGPLVPLDIVGHEITHGVVSNSANLIYNSESGALNESFADIFGEMVENHAQGNNDWLMGTDIGIGQSGAFRSMSDPKSKGDPDTYQGQNWWTSSGDNYGVHTNSGVQNKWFYILSQGETGTNDNNDSYAVTGIGITKAGEIAYRNLTVYLSANSNYAAARAGAIQSAIDLFGAGSPEEIATTNAWYAVGVGNAWGPPPPPAPCVDGNVTLTILLDNYPSETSWDIRDSNNTVVASGANYSGQGTTVTATATLNPGSYNFTIYDSYGDGICCAYGVGNYVLQSDTLIASGGAFGSSESTSFCVGSTADVTPPSNPTNLISSNTTQTTTDLNWTASTDNVGVIGYNVYQNGTAIGFTLTNSYSVSGLMASTTYNFTVEAFDAANNISGLSNVETVTTLASPDVTPPTNPTNLSSSNTTQNSTDLTWTASTDNVGVAGYNVYQGGNMIATVVGTSYSVTGLSPSTTYSFSVEAFDAASNVSGMSNTISVTTSAFVDNIPPTDPTGLSSSNTTQTSTDLSWTASTDNVGVAGYNVYQDNVAIGFTFTNSYSVSGLSPSTSYDFKVEAFDAANNISGFSNIETVLTLTPPDVTPPSNPTNLSSANTTQTTTDLSWTASTDNVGVTGYNVYEGANLLGTTVGTSYSVTGLTASTTYSFTVEAFDAANNVSGSSNVETVTTLANTGSTTVLHQGFFETGWDGWQDGGVDCKRVSTSTRSYEGTRSIRIRDNSGVASAMTSQAFDLTPYDFVEFSFYFYPNSMENNEDFWLRYYDGSSWSTLSTYTRGIDFNNNVFYSVVETIPSSAVNFASNAQFRLQCDASGNGDRIYIDQVVIKGIIGSGSVNNTIVSLGGSILGDTDVEDIEDGVYPNPVDNTLKFNGADEDASYRIVDMMGKLIMKGDFVNGNTVDVSSMSSGVYMIGIVDSEETEYHKFFKK